jgi:hypothetical protein
MRPAAPPRDQLATPMEKCLGSSDKSLAIAACCYV